MHRSWWSVYQQLFLLARCIALGGASINNSSFWLDASLLVERLFTFCAEEFVVSIFDLRTGGSKYIMRLNSAISDRVLPDRKVSDRILFTRTLSDRTSSDRTIRDRNLKQLTVCNFSSIVSLLHCFDRKNNLFETQFRRIIVSKFRSIIECLFDITHNWNLFKHSYHCFEWKQKNVIFAVSLYVACVLPLSRTHQTQGEKATVWLLPW